jgi:hypothetical protein
MKKAISSTFFFLLSMLACAQDIISVEDAIELYNTHDLEIVKQRLENSGYQYYSTDKDGGYWWYKNCDMTGTFHPGLAGSTSSVIRYSPTNNDIGFQLQLFDSDPVRQIEKQLESLGYKWNGTGTGMGARQFRRNPYDHDEQPIYFVDEQAYAYEFYGMAWVLIIGGELCPESLNHELEHANGSWRMPTQEDPDKEPNLLSKLEEIPISDIWNQYGLYIIGSIILLALLFYLCFVIKNDVVITIIWLSILTPIFYFVIYWGMHIGVCIAMLKEMVPDWRNMFIVINGFSVVGFISHIIGMLWNAVWCGASIAVPIMGLMWLGIMHSKTKYGRFLYFMVLSVLDVYAIKRSYLWVTTMAEPANRLNLIDYRFEDMYDYWILFAGHLVGGLLALFVSYFFYMDTFKHPEKYNL